MCDDKMGSCGMGGAAQGGCGSHEGCGSHGGCHGGSGRKHLVCLLVMIVVGMIVFWTGVKVGEVKASYGSWGNGRGGYPGMMNYYGGGYGMMRAQGGIIPPADLAATTSKR